MLKNKKAISLIVLVITIIIMIILAGTVILSLSDTDIFDRAKTSVKATNLKQLEEMAQVAWGNAYLELSIAERTVANLSQKVNEYLVNNGYTEDELAKYNIVVTKNGVAVFNKAHTKVNINLGDYVEYDVAYTDMLQQANEYSSLNGWRILKATSNADGSYSDVQIISTGAPAMLYYIHSDTSNNKSWWVTDNEKLSQFEAMLGEDYNLYDGDDEYKALKVAAGLYYNFGNIKFQYAASNRGNNIGYFKSIISKGVEYSSASNSNVEKTAKELFNLLSNSATVRLLTLPEVNIALQREDIDSTTTIEQSEDSLGLYVLDNLTEVANMESFTAYSSGSYWLAAPWPNTSLSTVSTAVGYVVHNGQMSTSSKKEQSVRPVISINSDKKVIFTDNDSNNVLEIVIVD